MKRRILSLISAILVMTFVFSLIGCESVSADTDPIISGDETETDSVVIPDLMAGNDAEDGELVESEIEIPTQNATGDATSGKEDTTNKVIHIPLSTEISTKVQLDQEVDIDLDFGTSIDLGFADLDINFGVEGTFELSSKESQKDETPEQTQKPTDAPTETEKEAEPETEKPTEKQTEAPTEKPTEAPTEKPTEAPTEKPTEAPTEKPTEAPTETETEPEEKKLTLRVGTYNIKHGEENPALDKIAANIVNTNLDILALQEVDKGTNRSGKVDQLKKLSELTGYKYYVFFKAINHDGGEYGIGILSKYPFENTKVWDLPNGSYENRVIGRVQIRVEGKLINFYATHLTPDFESKSTRTQQFAQIASIVKGNSNFIIAGDFNTGTFSEFSVLGNNANYNTTILNRTSQRVPTEPASNQPIDNISYRRWTFGTPQVVKKSYSDHYMLWGEGTFNG